MLIALAGAEMELSQRTNVSVIIDSGSEPGHFGNHRSKGYVNPVAEIRRIEYYSFKWVQGARRPNADALHFNVLQVM
jgi:hypothetical protein